MAVARDHSRRKPTAAGAVGLLLSRQSQRKVQKVFRACISQPTKRSESLKMSRSASSVSGRSSDDDRGSSISIREPPPPREYSRHMTRCTSDFLNISRMPCLVYSPCQCIHCVGSAKQRAIVNTRRQKMCLYPLSRPVTAADNFNPACHSSLLPP